VRPAISILFFGLDSRCSTSCQIVVSSVCTPDSWQLVGLRIGAKYYRKAITLAKRLTLEGTLR
jgi:hypothetical protein